MQSRQDMRDNKLTALLVYLFTFVFFVFHFIKNSIVSNHVADQANPTISAHARYILKQQEKLKRQEEQVEQEKLKRQEALKQKKEDLKRNARLTLQRTIDLKTGTAVSSSDSKAIPDDITPVTETHCRSHTLQSSPVNEKRNHEHTPSKSELKTAQIKELIKQRRVEAERIEAEERNAKREAAAVKATQKEKKPAPVVNEDKQIEAHSSSSNRLFSPQKKEEKNKVVVEEPTEKPRVPSARYEAKKLIVGHAVSLAEFSYTPAAQITLTNTLSYLYHFHRYNLCRQVLAVNAEQNRDAADLRTLFVHLVHAIKLTPEIILKTASRMNEYLPGEVLTLVQKGNFYRMDNHPDIKRLQQAAGSSISSITFVSIESLPLYQCLQNSSHEINSHAYSPDVIHPSDIYTWMMNTVLPYFNFLSKNNDLNSNSALNMLNIIIGEYCHHDMQKGISNYLNKETNASDEHVRGFIKMMKLCRSIRNDLAHSIILDNSNRQEKLRQLVYAITQKGVEIANIQEFTDSLLPSLDQHPTESPPTFRLNNNQ